MCSDCEGGTPCGDEGETTQRAHQIDEETVGSYICPDGLDPKRWCDVELRKPDMWGELRCLRCGWRGADIPQEQRYRWAGFAAQRVAERSSDTGQR